MELSFLTQYMPLVLSCYYGYVNVKTTKLKEAYLIYHKQIKLIGKPFFPT